MLIGLAATVLALAQSPSTDPPLPAEIRAYYQDHNFVVSQSSVEERQRLVSNDNRDQALDERLTEVKKRMARVAERTVSVDPGIALRRGADAAPIVRDTNFFELRSQDLDEEAGIALVELDVFALAMPDLRFAAREGAKGVIVSRGPVRPVPMRMAQATHRWKRVDGVWRREATTQLMVTQPGPLGVR